jgi:hypothetical protein
MLRRSLLQAALGGAVLPTAARAQAAAVTVIYVGGRDCPPCWEWKQLDRPDWLASALVKRVRYVEVEPATLREAYEAWHWPPDLRPVLDGLPRKAGTPRFVVLKGDQVVANEFGHTRWEATLEAIRAAVGPAAA